MPNWKFLEYSKRTPFRPSLGRGRPFPIARLENYNLKEANLVLRRFEDFRSRMREALYLCRPSCSTPPMPGLEDHYKDGGALSALSQLNATDRRQDKSARKQPE